MRAVIVQQDRTVAVEERPIPSLAENEILVKVEAAAQNPTDWKYVQLQLAAHGNILGCDFSGTVAQIAPNCKTSLAIGDHVAGFTHGGQYTDRGAYATYLKTDADLVWVVPRGTLTHDEAATMGCALWTAVQALFHPTRLGLVEPPERTTSPDWIFIYGGSTSVGQYAIQLAHLAGYKVATTASPRNHALLTRLGASAIFDYKSPDVVTQIKEATGDTLHLALDTVSSEASQQFCVRVLALNSPGKLVVLQAIADSATSFRADIHVQFTIIYTALGRAFTLRHGHFPASPADRAHMVQFLQKLPDLQLVPNNVRLWPGGLENVGKGLQWMMEGNVSAEKIVYRP